MKTVHILTSTLRSIQELGFYKEYVFPELYREKRCISIIVNNFEKYIIFKYKYVILNEIDM